MDVIRLAERLDTAETAVAVAVELIATAITTSAWLAHALDMLAAHDDTARERFAARALPYRELLAELSREAFRTPAVAIYSSQWRRLTREYCPADGDYPFDGPLQEATATQWRALCHVRDALPHAEVGLRLYHRRIVGAEVAIVDATVRRGGILLTRRYFTA